MVMNNYETKENKNYIDLNNFKAKTNLNDKISIKYKENASFFCETMQGLYQMQWWVCIQASQTWYHTVDDQDWVKNLLSEHVQLVFTNEASMQ